MLRRALPASSSPASPPPPPPPSSSAPFAPTTRRCADAATRAPLACASPRLSSASASALASARAPELAAVGADGALRAERARARHCIHAYSTAGVGWGGRERKPQLQFARRKYDYVYACARMCVRASTRRHHPACAGRPGRDEGLTRAWRTGEGARERSGSADEGRSLNGVDTHCDPLAMSEGANDKTDATRRPPRVNDYLFPRVSMTIS